MRAMSFQSCGWMPLTLVGLMLTGILCSYVWAVVREDIEAFVPFISEAGGNLPQSGFFGVFLFLSAAMGSVTLLVRFFSVRQDVVGKRSINYVNNVSLVLGLISLLGMVIVAAYPIRSLTKNKEDWRRLVAVPHTIGAFGTFFVGACYAIFQTAITYVLREKSRTNAIVLVVVRGIFCLLAIISVIVMVSFKGGDAEESGPQNSTSTTSTTEAYNMWQSSEGKMVNSVAEWVLALMLIGFFCSMYPELKHVRFVALVENIDESSLSQHSAATTQDSYGSTADQRTL